ncbi:hypothetical protein CHARACLAT_033405, partial [Characodon lateralis]|nr:hypothetical protein [Characodon lateralis]
MISPDLNSPLLLQYGVLWKGVEAQRGAEGLSNAANKCVLPLPDLKDGLSQWECRNSLFLWRCVGLHLLINLFRSDATKLHQQEVATRILTLVFAREVFNFERACFHRVTVTDPAMGITALFLLSVLGFAITAE